MDRRVDGIGGWAADVWSRVSSPQPPPADAVVLGAAVAVLVVLAVPVLWRGARHALTIVHEAAHAGVAVLVGRRLSGIRVHSDTSGLTVSRGKPRGPGMVAIAVRSCRLAVGGRGYGLCCIVCISVALVDKSPSY